MSAVLMPHTRWFEGVELNFADEVFAHRGLTARHRSTTAK